MKGSTRVIDALPYEKNKIDYIGAEREEREPYVQNTKSAKLIGSKLVILYQRVQWGFSLFVRVAISSLILLLFVLKVFPIHFCTRNKVRG